MFVLSHVCRALLALGIAVGLVACTDDPVAPAFATTPGSQVPLAAGAAPPGASVTSTVVVPSSMRSSPFNTTRTLLIPPNFTISVYGRIGGARFMAVTPDGNVLVSRPGSGSVVLVRPNGAGDPLVTDFVTGLKRPHDIVFHTIGTTTYVYISETNQVNRYVAE
jgi:hypothetical protein